MILFYVIIIGSVTDEDEVQQKSSNGKSIIKVLLIITFHLNIMMWLMM